MPKLKPPYFHYQNLNERPDKTTGVPYQARCWIGQDPTLRLEWNLFSNFCHIGITLLDYSDALMFKIAFPPFAFWLGIDDRRLSSLFYKKWPYGKEVGISIHDGSIFYEFWSRPGYWDNKTPKWRSGSFNVIDFVFGRREYSSKILEEKEIDIPMPEGNYPAKIKITLDSWKRKRGITKRIKRAHIDMVKPIPFPGKGENSWDCGDDACYGVTMPVDNVADAIGKMVSLVLHDRIRRGGPYKWK